MKRILAVMFIMVGLTISQDAKAITIVDSLGQATPNTKFSVFGSSASTISSSGQIVGPKFVLTQPTIITEIGGFMNNCAQIIAYQPLCHDTLPLTVQIHPSLNGIPDLSNTIDSFVMSHDNDPLIVSYEFVAPNLLLESGVYFAIFAAQGLDVGHLLGSASNPMRYRAESVDVGIRTYDDRVFVFQDTAAFRILGTPSSQSTPVPETSSTFALIGMGLIGLLSHNRSGLFRSNKTNICQSR